MHSAEAPTKQVATTGSANELLLLPDTTAKHDSIKYLKPIIKNLFTKRLILHKAEQKPMQLMQQITIQQIH